MQEGCAFYFQCSNLYSTQPRTGGIDALGSVSGILMTQLVNIFFKHGPTILF